MSTTHEQLPLINEGFAFKKAGERITHSEWNAIIELLTKCYNDLVVDTDLTANTILAVLADKAETDHTHGTTDITGLSTLLDTKVSTALTFAKTSGEFDGTGIESVVLENGNLIITLTTGETLNLGNVKGEKGDKGDQGQQGIQGEKGDTGAAGQNGVSVTKTEINNKGELIITLSDNTVSNLGVVVGAKGDKGDKGEDGADYILTDDDKREIATKANAVSYSVTQDLTKEQKQMARENIGAFNADKVKSTLGDLEGLSDNVLTVSGTMELIERRALNPDLPNNYPISYKYQMLKHLEGKWELLYTIEGDGATYIWEFTKFADGSNLKLRAAAVKTINTVAASADTYGFIYAYDSSFNTISTAVITRFLSKTAGDIAMGIIEQDKGYYRAYAVDGANKNPGNVRYSGFQQYNKIGNIETTPYIPRIKVINQTTAYLPVGSTIEVWGVKA